MFTDGQTPSFREKPSDLPTASQAAWASALVSAIQGITNVGLTPVVELVSVQPGSPDVGRVVDQTPLNDKNPETGKNIQDTVKWLNMAVGRPDVMSCDGERIYMRSQAFNYDGTRLPLKAKAWNGQADMGAPPPDQDTDHSHLFAATVRVRRQADVAADPGFDLHRFLAMVGRSPARSRCGYRFPAQLTMSVIG